MRFSNQFTVHHNALPHRRSTDTRHSFVDLIARYLVALAVIIAVGNLVGWASNIRFLISVRPHLPPMVPITALLVLITSVGVWNVHRSAAVSWRLTLAPAAVGLAAVLIVLCYLTGSPPGPFVLAKSGIENWFMLPSWITSGLLFCMACALILLTSKQLVAAAQGLAVLIFFVALLNLGGYLLQDTFLYQMLPNRGTSILTSTAVLSLAAAILFVRPHAGLMAAVTSELPGARVSRRLLVAAFLVPIMAGTIVLLGEHAMLYDAWTMLIMFVWIVILLFLSIVWRLAGLLAISDRERADAEQALQQAIGKLEQEHQSKDLFMATLAHELRNPLAPISSAAELLRHGGAKTDHERKRLGEIIAAQSANLVNLVNDLMDIERLNTGRLTLNRQPIDARKVISVAVEQIGPALKAKQHRYAVDLPIVPVWVCGDPHRLTQVFANLLGNAAKYTPPGGQIHVQAQIAGHFARIVVSDNGRGMDSELLSRVFEPYVQAHVTSGRADGGLGLGLALVKSLTELHGGTVAAHSDGAGAGSSFTVTLPLFDVRESANNTAQEKITA